MHLTPAVDPARTLPSTSPTDGDQRPPESRTRLAVEVKRILWDEGLARRSTSRGRRWAIRIYLVMTLGAGLTAGALEADGGSLLSRVKNDPVYLAVAILYFVIHAVIKSVDATLDDAFEFDRAVLWLTAPLRTGVPVVAVGYLVGGDLANYYEYGRWPGLTVTAIGAYLFLLVGGLWRAGTLAVRAGRSATPEASAPSLEGLDGSPSAQGPRCHEVSLPPNAGILARRAPHDGEPVRARSSPSASTDQ